jgi:hypothetical protein
MIRPVELLHHFGRRLRDPWRRYDRAIHDARCGGETWPDYSYAPAGIGAALLDRKLPDEPGAKGWPGVLDALAARRPTQGIYRFHPALLDALWDTSLTGDIPAELLRQLPEWCVYVETPDRSAGRGKPIHGFFAHVVRCPDGHDELRLLLDFALPHPMLVDESIPLVGNLEAGLRAKSREQNADIDLVHDVFVRDRVGYAQLVSLLLFLCSAEMEVRDAAGQKKAPKKPRLRRPKKRGKMARLPAAKEATVWETAFRLGERLETAGEAAAGTGRKLRPHVRRAHWHSYWRGPRDGEERRRTLKWISPLLINAESVARIKRVCQV